MSQQEIRDMKVDFLDSLSELTFNSKPIINNLTIIAEENVALAQGVVQALEEHLNKCPPDYKLPALYLMDSICKNVGNPYRQYFGLQLYKTFTNVFTVVNSHVRQKMMDLFDTWRRPGEDGQTLFSAEVIRKLGGFVDQVREKLRNEQRQRQAEHARQFMASGPMSARDLLAEVDKLVELTRQRQQIDRSSDAQEQLGILGQLKNILSSGTVAPEQLPVVQQQLATFNQKELERLNQLTQATSPHDLAKIMASGRFNVNTPTPPPQHYPQPVQQPVQQPIQQPLQQPVQPAQAPLPYNLIASLQSSGFLNKSATQTPTPPPPPPAASQVSIVVELTNHSLQQPRPHLIDRSYKDLSEQCTTCGRRFMNNAHGRKEKSAHLDWHFRTNKRLRDGNVQQSRAWYQPLDEWIQFNDEDVVLGLDTEQKQPEKPVTESKEELEKKYINVPPQDSKLARLPCPVCREKFERGWNDEAEQWVWKNAIKHKNRIFHATCHAEAGPELISKLLTSQKKQQAAPQPPFQPAQPSQQQPPAGAAPPPVDNNVLMSLLNSVKRKRDESNEPDDSKKVKVEH